MREAENIQAVSTLSPDLMGFIFYEKSPRFVEKSGFNSAVAELKNVKKVGVFVKTPVSEILEKVEAYQLDFVQLHGGESVEFCSILKGEGIPIIKVFSVSDQLPDTSAFEPYVSYFLFDTKTQKYGGSGQKFDWSILKSYKTKVPYFLSGGIHLNDLEEIIHLELPGLKGVDVNSQFEISPGVKDQNAIKELTAKIRMHADVKKI